jgi:hypothetical protein
MSFEIIDIASWPSGSHNEDRAGNAAELAWVIDGSTDIVDQPLTGANSDAEWLADEAHRSLEDIAPSLSAELPTLPDIINQRLAEKFSTSSRFAPREAWEHPAAATLIARISDHSVEWISLGDCSLIVETPTGLATVGIGGPDAGDRRIAAEVARLQESHDIRTEQSRREQMTPMLREARARRLNRPDGYAALSITPPPSHLIDAGTFSVTPGAHALLATDGLMRLIDIYARYDTASLMEAAKSLGLTELLREVRRIETDDGDCRLHPRIKKSDDATGLLLRFT